MKQVRSRKHNSNKRSGGNDTRLEPERTKTRKITRTRKKRRHRGWTRNEIPLRIAVKLSFFSISILRSWKFGKLVVCFHGEELWEFVFETGRLKWKWRWNESTELLKEAASRLQVSTEEADLRKNGDYIHHIHLTTILDLPHKGWGYWDILDLPQRSWTLLGYLEWAIIFNFSCF